MPTLSAFLNPITPENKKVYISDRFQDENGKSVPFIIRAVSDEESNAIRRRCTRMSKDRAGNMVKEFDSERFSRLFLIAGTVQPDFQASDLCDAYGVVDPELAVGKMLLAGESAQLMNAIAELSGMREEAAAEVYSEAKN